MSILPEIGDSGNYTFNAPFNVYDSSAKVTCVGISKLSEFISYGKNAKVIIYDNFGISDRYLIDLEADINIVTFMVGPGGMRFYVPDYTIQFISNIDGVNYTGIILTIDIGAMPVTQDYSLIIDGLKETIKKSLGIISDIRIVEATSKTTLTIDQHNTIQSARQILKDSSGGCVVQYAIIENAFSINVKKLRALEAYIKKYLCEANIINENSLGPCVIRTNSAKNAMIYNIFATTYFSLQDIQSSYISR